MHPSLKTSVVVAFLIMLASSAVADDRQTCERDSGEAAIAACSRAIASGQFAGLELAKLHTNRGVELKRKGDLDGAIADYDQAIRLNPADHFAFNNRGNTLRDKGDLDRAIADYTEALRLDPGYTAVYINRGLVYERRKELTLARADYEAALARPPKYANGPGGQEMARRRLRELSKTP